MWRAVNDDAKSSAAAASVASFTPHQMTASQTPTCT